MNNAQAPGRRSKRLWFVAPLLFGSGFCGLVEQVAWEREFRLVFGMTTAATAAVVAIFIGGLGIGSAWLGKRADRHARPLMLYGNLELGVGILVGITPLLLHGVRLAYAAIGGTTLLGPAAGGVVRLLFAALVLGPPTILMGGTLPAAARSVEYAEDDSRSATAVLYGINTVGAVVGALACALLMVEVFGNRVSLWIAALISTLVGMFARMMARSDYFSVSPQTEKEADKAIDRSQDSGSPWWIVVAASAVVGFAFFVMELVAPRMLGPLLGGTVFTFGLVLAVALAGVGIGGLLYGRKPRTPRLSALGITCVLESLAFAIPLVMGDRLALLALRLRLLHDFGFAGYVAVAVLITSVVLLPAAIVSGYQFPLLIGLLGSGHERVGRDVGRVYAANTLGAVAGALAGGFFLMQSLSAPGCWRLVIVLLAVCGLAVTLVDVARRKQARINGLSSFALGAIALGCGFGSVGPTAVWRHGGVGAGRANAAQYATPNLRKFQENFQRSSVLLERDGREASVALLADDQVVLFVSGKADGSSRTDSATQVGSGLIAALRHPAPRRALVVGLATGCTAGWLAKIPSIERVDVLEIEPVMLEVARLLAPVNENALENPKVRVILQDAREHLLTTRERYDIIVSEPSNPYRAGVATLYTQELYKAVAQRLNPNGLFGQWVQAYEVDAAALRIAFGTVTSVFPHTELWELSQGDLMMLSSQEELSWHIDELQARAETEPFKRGLRVSMQTEGAQGVLARLRARDPFVLALAGDSPVVNTDDQNLLEFSFARTLGRQNARQAKQILALSRAHKMDTPPNSAPGYNRDRVLDEVASIVATEGVAEPLPSETGEAVRIRAAAKQAYAQGNCSEALGYWKHQTAPPQSPVERLLFAECATEASNPEGETAREDLAATHPSEALLLQARVTCNQGDDAACAGAMTRVAETLRRDVWVFLPLARRSLQALQVRVRKHPALGQEFIEALKEPFAVWNLEATRRDMLASTARSSQSAVCRKVYEDREPNPSWDRDSLKGRLKCYERTASPWLQKARADLSEYYDAEPSSFD